MRVWQTIRLFKKQSFFTTVGNDCTKRGTITESLYDCIAMTESPPAAKKLSFSTKLAYGAGDLGPAITANVMAFFLLFFFTSVAGLNAGLAGTILLIGKIWDAVNDPIVGVLSDRTAPIQPPSALLAIRLAIGPLPTLVLIAGIVLAYFYPITREVHARILLKLKERKARQG